jgi:hypothetical protein
MTLFDYIILAATIFVTKSEGLYLVIHDLHDRGRWFVACFDKSASCRGCVVQERVLAPKIVYFGHMFAWDCRKAIVDEYHHVRHADLK